MRIFRSLRIFLSAGALSAGALFAKAVPTGTVSAGILFAGVLLSAGGFAARAQPPVRQLSTAFSAFCGDEQMQYGTAALYVLDAGSGELVFAANEDQGMAPASSLKTVTSITAFELLGKDFRYETVVSYAGQLGPDGVLHGDLIVKGSGDPTLGSPRWKNTKAEAVLERWVSAVREKGIRRIEGRVIGDQRIMETQTVPGDWQWDDLGNYYGAGAAGLNWRENQFDVLLQPSSVGGPVRITGTRPPMEYLQLVSELRTGPAGTGDRAYVYLPPYGRTGYLRGTYAIDGRSRSISGSVPDPAFECAYRFTEALRAADLPVSGAPTTSRLLELEGETVPEPSGRITVSRSPGLDQIIYWFNHRSINLYGESLLKTMALSADRSGSTMAGVHALREFWAAKGIDSNSLHIRDGSGLSPAGRVTAETMGKILLEARGRPWFASFYNSLPEQNGLRMKSGYIHGVRAYAGYHTGSAGIPYVFVFLVNNFSGSPSEVRLKMWKLLDILK